MLTWHPDPDPDPYQSGSGSIITDADPDPHQNDTDPKHWLIKLLISLRAGFSLSKFSLKS